MTVLFADSFDDGFNPWDYPNAGVGDVPEVINVNENNLARFYVDGVLPDKALVKKTFAESNEIWYKEVRTINGLLPVWKILNMISIRDMLSRPIANVDIQSDGVNTFYQVRYVKNGTTVAATGPNITANTEIEIKFHLKVDAVNGAIELMINGELIISDSGFNNADFGLIASAITGIVSSDAEIQIEHFVDDVVITDSLPAPMHTLEITSIPEGIPFTVNGVERVTPYTENLEEGVYTVEMPDIVMVGEDQCVFSEWGDASTNLTRVITLSTNMSFNVSYEIQVSQESYLSIQAFLDGKEVNAEFEVEGVTTGTTPAQVMVEPGTYTVKAFYNNAEQSSTVEVTTGQTVSIDFKFTAAGAGIILPLAVAVTAVLAISILGK